MKKTYRKRLALHGEVIRALAELPVAELRAVRGGSDRTTPDGGCASTTVHGSVPTSGTMVSVPTPTGRGR